MNKTFVIAKYNEDIGWTSQLVGEVVVYDKSVSMSNPDLILVADSTEDKPKKKGKKKVKEFSTEPNYYYLENVGREAHTYIKYIVDNYDKLPEWLVFTQADPYPHVGNYLEKFNSNNDNKFWDFEVLKNKVFLCPDGVYRFGSKICNKEWADKLRAILDILEIPYEDGTEHNQLFEVSYFGIFQVHSSNILKYSKDKWQKLLEIAEKDVEFPYVIEFLWKWIFTGTIKRK